MINASKRYATKSKTTATICDIHLERWKITMKIEPNCKTNIAAFHNSMIKNLLEFSASDQQGL